MTPFRLTKFNLPDKNYNRIQSEVIRENEALE